MSTIKSQVNDKELVFEWPDDQLDPDMLAKFNGRISKFALEQPESLGEGVGDEVQAKFDLDEGAAALELCVDLYKIYKDSDDPSVEEELLALGAEWKTVEPGYAYIRNFFSLLMTGELEAASKNIEKSEEYKKAMITEGVTQAKSQAGTDLVNKKHGPNNRTKAQAIEFYKINKDDYASKIGRAHV